jgi:hypothetical protein
MSVGDSAQVIRTSNTENWKELSPVAMSGKTLKTSLAGHSVTTFIIDGCKADVQSGMTACPVSVSGSKSWKDSENDYTKVFDGDTATYFDGVEGGWVMADLGMIYDLNAISYCPRKGYEYRMTDGYFEVSTDKKNWTKVYTVTETPKSGMHKIKLTAEQGKARYVRYSVPTGKPQNADNPDDVYCCNIAEIKLSGKVSIADNFEKIAPVELSGTNSWKDQESSDYNKAFDGSTSTYFDGLGAGWAQAKLERTADIAAIGFAPRSGYEYRMADGYFEASEGGTNWTRLYTVSGVPGGGMQYVLTDKVVRANYIRYAVPEGAPDNGVNKDSVYCCNIAEIEIYAAPEQVHHEPIRGDVDMDDEVDVADIIALQKYLLGYEQVISSISSDVTGDGEIDIFDLGLLKRLVLLGGKL